MSTPQATEDSSEQVTPTDLTRFQLDLLRIIERDGPVYGLAIKDAIEEHYDEDINHGRLYPNLDDLVDYGLVDKGQRDRRTNDYELTIPGQLLLKERREWVATDQSTGPQRATIANGGGR